MTFVTTIFDIRRRSLNKVCSFRETERSGGGGGHRFLIGALDAEKWRENAASSFTTNSTGEIYSARKRKCLKKEEEEEEEGKKFPFPVTVWRVFKKLRGPHSI